MAGPTETGMPKTARERAELLRDIERTAAYIVREARIALAPRRGRKTAAFMEGEEDCLRGVVESRHEYGTVEYAEWENGWNSQARRRLAESNDDLDSEHDQAAREGRQAAKDGKTPDDNPYREKCAELERRNATEPLSDKEEKFRVRWRVMRDAWHNAFTDEKSGGSVDEETFSHMARRTRSDVDGMARSEARRKIGGSRKGGRRRKLKEDVEYHGAGSESDYEEIREDTMEGLGSSLASALLFSVEQYLQAHEECRAAGTRADVPANAAAAEMGYANLKFCIHFDTTRDVLENGEGREFLASSGGLTNFRITDEGDGDDVRVSYDANFTIAPLATAPRGDRGMPHYRTDYVGKYYTWTRDDGEFVVSPGEIRNMTADIGHDINMSAIF